MQSWSLQNEEGVENSHEDGRKEAQADGQAWRRNCVANMSCMQCNNFSRAVQQKERKKERNLIHADMLLTVDVEAGQ